MHGAVVAGDGLIINAVMGWQPVTEKVQMREAKE